MVIEGQEVLPIFGKGIGFPHEFEGSGGIGGKDSYILLGRGLEIVQHSPPSTIHQNCHGLGSRVGGVRIAEHIAAQQLHILPYLAFGIESPTGVIQIHLLVGVQASIVSDP